MTAEVTDGKKSVSSEEWNTLVEQATPKQLAEISYRLGIDPRAATAEQVRSAVEAAMLAEQTAPKQKSRLPEKIHEGFTPGAHRYTLSNGRADITIVRDGDRFYLYDHGKGRLMTEALDIDAVNKLLADEAEWNAKKNVEKKKAPQSEADTSKTGGLNEESAKIAEVLRENVKEYSEASAKDRTTLRRIYRQAIAHGFSQEDALVFTAVAARSGLNIVFDKARCQFVDENGVLREGRGFYSAERGTIVINPDEKAELVLIHELDHCLRTEYKNGKMSPRIYMEAIKQLPADVNAKIIKTYKKVSTQLSSKLEQYADESNAYYAEMTLGNMDVLRYLVADHPSLKQRILSFFKKASADYAGTPKLEGYAKKYLKQYKKAFDQLASENAGTLALAETVDDASAAVESGARQYAAEITAKMSETEKATGKAVAEFIENVNQMADKAKRTKRKMKIGTLSAQHIFTINALMQTIDSEFSAEGYELWIDGTSAQHIEARHGEHGEADTTMATKETKSLIPWVAQNAEAGAFITDSKGNIRRSDRFFNKDGSKAPEIRLEKSTDQGVIYVSECVPDSANKRIWVTSAYANKKGSKGQLLNMEDNTSPQPTPEASFDGIATTIIIPDPATKVNPSDEKSSGKVSNLDSEYLSAVESGDMDTAQKMVDDASAAVESGARYELLTDEDLTDYMTTGKTLHTRHKKQHMLEHGKKPILTSESEIREFISNAIQGKAGGEVRAFARVSKRLSDAISAVRSTLDLEGNYLEFQADALREAYKVHSSPKMQGDIALTESDFENLHHHIFDFDGVLSVNDHNGKTEVHIYRRAENGYYQIITVSSSERKSLQITKLIGVSKEKFEGKYAKKIERNTGSPRMPKASTPSTKARHTAGALSTTIIPETAEKINPSDEKSSGKVSDGQFSLPLEDSEGSSLSPEQREFFAETKVLDKSGKLLALYHGTPKENGDFYVFDYNKSKRKGGFGLASAGKGFYFTTKKEAAEIYTRSGGRLLSVYVNIKNPYIVNGDVKEQISKDFGIDPSNVYLQEVRRILSSKGYDGIIQGKEDTLTVVAYYPEQIKLTSNKKPTADPDIRYSITLDSASNGQGAEAYSYEALTSKQDLAVVELPDSVPMKDGRVDRAAVLAEARKNARAQEHSSNTEKETFVFVPDIGLTVRVAREGIDHGLSRNSEDTALATMKIGTLLSCSVAVNELDGRSTRKKTTDMSYVLLAAAQNKKSPYLVRIVVDKNTNSLSEISTYGLGAVKAKKEGTLFMPEGNVRVEDDSSVSYLRSTISIADLLENVKSLPLANEVFSMDVLEKLGVARTKGTLSDSVRYALPLEPITPDEAQAQEDLQRDVPRKKQNSSDSSPQRRGEDILKAIRDVKDLSTGNVRLILNRVWGAMNESVSAEEKRAAVEYTADFLMEKVMREDHSKYNPNVEEARQVLSYLRTGIGRLVFSDSDVAKLKHVFGKDGMAKIRGRWGYKGKGTKK